MNEVRDMIWDVNAAVIFSICLDKQMFVDFLRKEHYPLSENELNVLWEKAVEPAFESFDKSQLSHLLTLVKDGISWEEIIEKCQYMLTDYHSARTLPEVENMLRERYVGYVDDPKVAADMLETEIKEVEGVTQAHEKWLESLPQNEKTVAYYLQAVMRIRDRRKNFFAKGLTLWYRVAERMFREAGIERDLIPYYTVRELLKGIEHLKATTGDLAERKKGFQWLVPYVGEVQAHNTNIDAGVEKINAYFKDSHATGGNADVVKGQSAFKGVVQGRVRIVLDVSANHGFTQGEILVAGMTRPEYVPLMKKAAGIVTDEGGITCHAAIVSRELKIPCVTGTKIATRLLKDGDLVEVDANEGIVKILK